MSGILLFSIMEDQVWTPASSDSTGILEYYQVNESNYIDSATYELAIFSSAQKSVIDSIQNALPNKKSVLGLSKSEKEALQFPKSDSSKVSLWLEIDEYQLDELALIPNGGVTLTPEVKNMDNLWYYLVPIRQAGEARRLSYIRGRVIADYQEALETEWLIELAKKYPVSINEKALKLVYNKLEAN